MRSTRFRLQEAYLHGCGWGATAFNSGLRDFTVLGFPREKDQGLSGSGFSVRVSDRVTLTAALKLTVRTGFAGIGVCLVAAASCGPRLWSSRVYL